MADVTQARLSAFETERGRLLGIGYRILGTVADAEDVLQEAWIRWSDVDLARVRNPEAFLTTVVTRLALDRLRRVKARREVYPGSWLPEPVPSEPEDAADLADSLSMALLTVLESLSPLERAAFVLREVFARPYAEVAETLDRSEPAVRQLVHRARERVTSGHARYAADRSTHEEVLRRFVAACETADLSALLELLAPDAVVIADGGGVARAPRRPIHGRDKAARFLVGISQRGLAGARLSLEVFNGRLGGVIRVGDTVVGALAVTVAGDQVQTLHLLANPAKLAALASGTPIELP